MQPNVSQTLVRVATSSALNSNLNSKTGSVVRHQFISQGGKSTEYADNKVGAPTASAGNVHRRATVGQASGRKQSPIVQPGIANIATVSVNQQANVSNRNHNLAATMGGIVP